MLVMNEDFVPYEVAIKLKQKGFDIPCIYAYCEKGGWNKYRQVREPITHILKTDGNPFGTFYCGKNWNIKYETNTNKICCSAPTIFQVLKWLRDVKELHIELYMYHNCYLWEIYNTQIYDADSTQKSEKYSEIEYKTYEEATLAGIEYVLDNLI